MHHSWSPVYKLNDYVLLMERSTITTEISAKIDKFIYLQIIATRISWLKTEF